MCGVSGGGSVRTARGGWPRIEPGRRGLCARGPRFSLGAQEEEEDSEPPFQAAHFAQVCHLHLTPAEAFLTSELPLKGGGGRSPVIVRSLTP